MTTGSWNAKSYTAGQTMVGTIDPGWWNDLLCWWFHQCVLIDTTRPIMDHGVPPRNWVVSANKLSITATA